MADEHPIENWRPVVGYEDLYEVSDLGRVRSVARMVRRRGQSFRRAAARLRRLYTLPNGYVQIDLWRNNERSKVYVHHAVLSAFVCSRPDGMEACHNNGTRADNRISNLRWDTHANNKADQIAHGTHQFGARHYATEVSEEAVREMFVLAKSGISRAEIGRKLGVSGPTVAGILRGESWNHLGLAPIPRYELRQLSIPCSHCGSVFTSKSTKHVRCSTNCNQAAYKARKKDGLLSENSNRDNRTAR